MNMSLYSGETRKRKREKENACIYQPSCVQQALENEKPFLIFGMVFWEVLL